MELPKKLWTAVLQRLPARLASQAMAACQRRPEPVIRQPCHRILPEPLSGPARDQRLRFRQTERRAMLLHRPSVAPGKMLAPDPAQPLPARMALTAVILGVVPNLADGPVVRGAVHGTRRALRLICGYAVASHRSCSVIEMPI